MNDKVYAIFDTKVEAYLRPFFCKTPGEAIRTFTDAINDIQSPFHRHPADFVLFEIGTFDERSAQLEAIPPTNLGTGLQYHEDSHSG